MYRYIALFIVAAFSISVCAGCDEFFYDETKPNVSESKNYTTSVQEVCYTEFAVLYSQTLNAPLYSVQRLSSDQIKGANSINRKNTFHSEPKVGAVVSPKDYINSGYDKGHLAPAGDASTLEAQNETFTMANMVPQSPENNRVVWKSVERQIHDAAARLPKGQYLYVVTGALFGENRMRGKIGIPEYMFKAVYSPSTGHVGVYVAPNNDTLTISAMSLRSFESMAKMDPFPTPDADTKSRIKLNCH